ncbi:MAG: four helix bundle protein [Bdellovibrionota bacterium]|mgnify:FL=1
MLQNFRTYQLALNYYHACKKVHLPNHLKDQLMRASSSIALNLAEGSAEPTHKDRMKFYRIALGSLRETQAIISLEQLHILKPNADHLGASLYKLTHC